MKKQSNQTRPKMTLSKETLRLMTPLELRVVVGGSDSTECTPTRNCTNGC
ncbi:MAG TPA: hypothetical protein VH877_17055 [Polyangia bacterium]|jgi:hypothetical protein|nr:hypothetical protein [Polyangia bacterium]